MDKKKLNKARNKIDKIDNSIFYLIKERTKIVKYMLSLKKFKIWLTILNKKKIK